MTDQLPPFLRYYDRLVAVAGLVVLLISLIFLVVKGVDLQKQVNEYDGELAAGQPSTQQVTPVDTTATLGAIDAVKQPPKGTLLSEQNDPSLPNVATAERRLLCVKCTKPIRWDAEVCAFCAAEQPKEKKIDLASVDSDGDGIPDGTELLWGLNPHDESDAEQDLDGDGFTNLEEYLAGTKVNDAASHPGYESRIKLKGIAGTKLNLRFVNTMELPTTTVDGKTERHYQVTFVKVGEDGKVGKQTLRVNDGKEIGKSGFIFVRYNEQPKKELKSSKGTFLRLVDVSTVDLKRVSDGKEISTVFWDEKNPEWPGDPLLEQRATLDFDVPQVDSVTVAPGEIFAVKDEKYTVLSIDADKKVVRIKKNATNTVFELK